MKQLIINWLLKNFWPQVLGHINEQLALIKKHHADTDQRHQVMADEMRTYMRSASQDAQASKGAQEQEVMALKDIALAIRGKDKWIDRARALKGSK